MASLGSLLKSEITRLSRKELRTQIEPLKKTNSTYRRDIAELKRQVIVLQRQLSASQRATNKPTNPSTELKPTRFVAKGLRSLRTRLGVSANDFGKLAGASAQSVYNWETGKAVPRKAQLAVLADLRSLSKKDAQARLNASTTAKKSKKRISKKT